MLAIYAERDTRITSTKDQIEKQLSRTGRPYQITVYPGVDHAFHEDPAKIMIYRNTLRRIQIRARTPQDTHSLLVRRIEELT